MISIYFVLTGEKKPKAVKKVKAEAVSDDSGEDVKKVKKVTKAKVAKGDSEIISEVTPVKKTKVTKTITTEAVSGVGAVGAVGKESKVKKTKATAVPIDRINLNLNLNLKDEFEGNDMFDLKELLGDDFLSESEGGMGMGLLPNLDEDLAKLEANLSELGDFGFDFMGEMDDDDDEALRSIESGKFDIEEFLKDGADVDELLSGVFPCVRVIN